MKRALTDVARREGKSVASVVREAVADVVEHSARSQEPAASRRGVR